MLAHHWGVKTFYYSLINKQGAKSRDTDQKATPVAEEPAEEDCEACKL